MFLNQLADAYPRSRPHIVADSHGTHICSDVSG